MVAYNFQNVADVIEQLHVPFGANNWAESELWLQNFLDIAYYTTVWF